MQDKISGTFYLCIIFFSYRAVCVALTINIAFIFISAKAIQARSLIVHDNITHARINDDITWTTDTTRVARSYCDIRQ